MSASDVRASSGSWPAFSIKLRDFASWDDLVSRVDSWLGVGVSGVVVSDHIFTERAVTRYRADRHEAAVVFAALAARFPQLTFSLLVSNVGLQHPFFVIRQFAELSYLFGGDRFTLGLGAGWNRAEFNSLGLKMPDHKKRISRLAASCELALELFERGMAQNGSLESGLAYERLPLVPVPGIRPLLAVGGASRPVLDVAARFADVVDFDAAHPWSKSQYEHQIDGKTMDILRRLRTTTWDVVQAQDTLRGYQAKCGRGEEQLLFSININSVVVGDAQSLRAKLKHDLTARLQTSLSDDLFPVDLGECPFVLCGQLDEMLEALKLQSQALSLDRIVLPDNSDTFLLLQRLHG